MPTIASPDVAGALSPSLAWNHPCSNSRQDNCTGVDDIGGCLFERRPQPFGTTKLV